MWLPCLALLALGSARVGSVHPMAGSRLLEPYDRLFSMAVEAYYRDDWQGVILNMERALQNRAALRRVKVHCRTECSHKINFNISNSGQDLFLDTNFFDTVLRKADCLRGCQEERLGPHSLHHISEEVQLEFHKRTPYNYLQAAYFKIKMLDKAVAAAHTFFVVNPDHLEMRQNLEYYKMMAGVKDADFKDLEAKVHMEAFRQGVSLYTDEQFKHSVHFLEKALEEYFKANAECRALCEGPYNFDGYNYMDYNADLYQAITDHYIQVLGCKQNCVTELAIRPDREAPIEDFLPTHLDYLQFAYYNSENYSQAIECTKTYLLFYPNDEVMNQNLQYYQAVLGDELSRHLTHREDIQTYINNSLLEKELLYFANEVFGITFIDPDKWTPESVIPVKLKAKQKAERETAARISEEIGNLMKEIENLVDEKTKESSEIVKMVKEGGPLLFDGVQVVMNARLLNGTQRVLLDGVITDEECEELHSLSNAAATLGDGYYGKPSPHTPNERFQGLTVLKALKLSQSGTVPLKTSRLFYDVSEKVRRIIESYFRMETPLHFAYTHLVCRTAVEGMQDKREDLSHSVHVDNCILNSEALECPKEHPAYTERDYSAILYLNHDFEGGNFIFTEIDAKVITATVNPTCGRVVGFSSGAENPHGVQAVTKGQRCGVALWFTLDAQKKERERIEADDLVKMLFGMEEELRPNDGDIKELIPTDHRSSKVPTDHQPSKVPIDLQPSKVLTDHRPSKVPIDLQPSKVPTDHRPSKVPIDLQPSKVPIDHQPSKVPTDHRPSKIPTDHRPSKIPTDHQPSEIPTDHQQSEIPTDHQSSKVPIDHQPSKVPTDHRPSKVPTDHRSSKVPIDHQPSKVPTDHRPSEIPTDHQPSEIPTDHRSSKVPIDHQPSKVPTDRRPSEIPTDHRSSEPSAPEPIHKPQDVAQPAGDTPEQQTEVKEPMTEGSKVPEAMIKTMDSSQEPAPTVPDPRSTAALNGPSTKQEL